MPQAARSVTVWMDGAGSADVSLRVCMAASPDKYYSTRKERERESGERDRGGSPPQKLQVRADLLAGRERSLHGLGSAD